MLFCEKTDRLYRDFKDYVTIDEPTLTLVFVKEGSSLSEETRKGMLERAEEAAFPGTVNKTIVADAERAPAVWELFNLYASGEYSIRRLQIHAADCRQAAKLRNRLNQIYLDKLDGEIEYAFYRKYVSKWRKEHDQILTRIRRHQKADENYVDQGIRLLELARKAVEFFRTHGQEERAVLLRFILQGSTLRDGKVIAVFTPPFDIIRGPAAGPREAARQGTTSPDNHSGTKEQVAGNPTTCPTFLPRLGEPERYSLSLRPAGVVGTRNRTKAGCESFDRSCRGQWLWAQRQGKKSIQVCTGRSPT